jgi:hypothetical protein
MEELAFKIEETKTGARGSMKKKFMKLYNSSRQLEDFNFPAEIITITANGEADVFLGEQPPDVLRISGDSDSIFYLNAQFVARPVRDGNSVKFKVKHAN